MFCSLPGTGYARKAQNELTAFLFLLFSFTQIARVQMKATACAVAAIMHIRLGNGYKMNKSLF